MDDETTEARNEPTRKRMLLSEDVPVLTFAGVLTAYVLMRFGLASTLIGVGLSIVLTDLIRNYARSKGWTPRRLWTMTLLLLGADRAHGAPGRSRRARPEPRRVALAATAAASALLALGFVTVPGRVLPAGGHAVRELRVDPPSARPFAPPTVTVPGNLVVRSDGPARVPYVASAVVDGEPAAPSCSPPSGTTFPPGETTVTCRAGEGEDAAVGTFTVTVRPAGGPLVLTLPAARRAEASSARGAVVRFRVSAVDGAGSRVRVRCLPRPATLFPVGRTTVRCTARKRSQHAAGSFAVQVRDTRAPRLAVPPALTLESGREAGRRVTFAASAVDRVDGPVGVRCVPGSGSTFPLGTTSVRCVAVDDRRNRAERSFRVTVLLVDDREPPRLELEGARVEATTPAGAVVRYRATASDDRDGNLLPRCSRASGTTFPVGTTTVRCVADDAAGNRVTGSLAVSVVDTIAPRLAVPAPIRAEATGRAGARIRFAARASDRGAALPAQCTPASGTTFAVGTTRVRCSAVDAAGRRAAGGFTVTVVDTTPPRLAIRAPRTVEATSPAGAEVAYEATATDLVAGAIAPSCAPAPGVLPLGSTTITCSAVDAHGNRAAGSATVAVVDTTPPALRIDAPGTVEAASQQGAQVAYGATATDLVGGEIAPACSPAPGTFPIGKTTVTCTAADASGNRSSGTATVTVADTTPPRLRIDAPGRVEATGPEGAAVSYTAVATDVVSGPVTPSCTPARGVFPVGETTISCTATDAAGNVAEASATVAVVDTGTPALRLPVRLVLPARSTGLPFMFDVLLGYAAAATDAIDPAPRVECTPPSGTLHRFEWHDASAARVTVVCTATDRSGNATRGSFVIFVTIPSDPGPR